MDLDRLKSELDFNGHISTWATMQLIGEVEKLRAENEELKKGDQNNVHIESRNCL